MSRGHILSDVSAAERDLLEERLAGDFDWEHFERSAPAV